MIKLAGICLLVIFILYTVWILAKFNIEVNYHINKKVKKKGHEGNYYSYKRQVNRKRKNIQS